MAKKMGLGKGLGAIFGEDIVDHKQESSEAVVPEKDTRTKAEGKAAVKKQDIDKKTEKEQKVEGREIQLKLSAIEPNYGPPRKDFKEESIRELADSMKKYGVLQPLLVQKKGERYEIIAGERRWRAAKEAGLKEVPVIIREYTRQQTMEIALIENVQREDLNPIEEAMAYQQLLEEFGLTQEEIASRVFKNRATITNSMRLLKLDKRVQDMLVLGQISSGHARAHYCLWRRENNSIRSG